jgi:Uma2 family endonuclease
MGTTTTLMTAEQLWQRADSGRAELVYGELVERMPLGLLHSLLVGCIFSWLREFVLQHKLGVVGTELGFILERDPDLVYAPDVFFLSKNRVRPPYSKRFFEGAADLAVEVLSPDDRAGQLHQKIRAYLKAGTRMVWVVDPDNNTVIVYHPSGDAHVYSGQDEVTGEDVLPGFSFTPERLFKLE